MDELKDELKDELENKRPSISVPKVETKAERTLSASVELKEFKDKTELESRKLGYASLIEREKAQAEKDTEFANGIKQLSKDRDSLNREIDEFRKKAETQVEEYNQKYALLQTKLKEAGEMMDKALQVKANADAIIERQTEVEKERNEKQKAYEENLTECLETFVEMGANLVKYGSSKGLSHVLNLGKIVKVDCGLIERMQEKKTNLASIADVISVDVDRIIEMCEPLQGIESYTKFVNYLSDNIEYLTKSLKINWQPSDKQILKI